MQNCLQLNILSLLLQRFKRSTKIYKTCYAQKYTFDHSFDLKVVLHVRAVDLYLHCGKSFEGSAEGKQFYAYDLISFLLFSAGDTKRNAYNNVYTNILVYHRIKEVLL